MAIAFDASSQGGANAGVSSLTVAHTCSGSNRILFVFVDYQGADRTISGATYNGVAMTAIYPDTTYNAARKLAFFYLIAPATGANNIVVSISGGNTTQRLGLCATSYTGAKQSGQPDAYNSELTGTSVASKSISVTTVSDFVWLVGGVLAADILSAGANTTIRTIQPGSFDDVIRMADSNGTKTPAGSHALAYAVTPNNQIVGFVASFPPAPDQSATVTDTVTLSEVTTTANAQKSFTQTDTVSLTDTYTEPDWINAPKSSVTGVTNQPKS